LLKPLTSRPGNLTDMVLEALKEAIIDKTLAPGQRISEAALAESLQVSKTPVREVLLRLRYIGLVEQSDRGLRVIMPASSTIRYAYELRAGIERTSASLAAERASPDDLAQIAELATESLRCARAGDANGFRQQDFEFHTVIARAARNPILAGAQADVLVLTRALRERDVPPSGDSVGCAEEHLAASHALSERDGESAGRIIHDHVLHVMRMVLATLSAGDPGADGQS
jgi:DNA-binding GntR family transcriptional regulator